MMTAVEGWLHRGRRKLLRFAARPGIRALAEGAAWGGGGFLMSAASLANSPLPLPLGVIAGAEGWKRVVSALGSALGYRFFWGAAGAQGVVWSVLGCLAAFAPGRKKLSEEAPLLAPAVAGFLVSAAGLVFQMALGDSTPVGVYLLRIAMAAAVVGLAGVMTTSRQPVADWLTQGLAVLALAQIAPLPWLDLGVWVAGLLAAGGSVPAAILAGLALDLAQITTVPMTAVLCAAALLRMIPFAKKWPRYAAPGAAYCLVMALTGRWDLAPLPGLVLGGSLGALLPPRPEQLRRRGETGAAQVRLELMAGVLQETRQLLLEDRSVPIDCQALLLRTRERACGGCPNRKLCRDITLPESLLTQTLWDTASLSIPCKKPGRMVLELRRTQEQLRQLKGERDRRRECREAVAQQYRFLGDFLREQADLLPRRGSIPRPRFRPEAEVCSRGRELANGDRFLHFPGIECRYYALLCDGMGTGLGAAQEGQSAASLLRQLLTAGFPAEHALRTLNSLLVLRGRAGAVTVDLAELRLDTGRVTLYKWGAAPSYLLRGGMAEKIGTAGPPPGLSISENRETVERLSLRRGEALILFSDGVDAPAALRREGLSGQMPPGELAALLLEGAEEALLDDATAAVIRLSPATLST